MSDFPNIDPGELRSLAQYLGNAANDLISQGGSVDNTTGGVAAKHAGWQGAAHDMWMGQGSQASSDLFAGSAALSWASQTISTLAGKIEQARQRFDSAQGRAADASFRAFTGELRKLDPIEALIPGQSHRIQQEIDQAHADQKAAQGDADAAVADALAAGAAASGQLASAAGTAGGVGRFGGGTPASPHGGSGQGPDPYFLTLIFGSVIGENYANGRAFQEAIQQKLGLPENNTTYPVQLPNGKTVNVKPDSMQGGVWEFKDQQYVYRSSQIRGEMQQAAAEGKPYNLVIGPKTRVSRPLLRDIERQGGEVVRYDPQTQQFTDRAGRPVERTSAGGWRYQDPNDAADAAKTGNGLLQEPAAEPGNPAPEPPPPEPPPAEPPAEPAPVGPEDPAPVDPEIPEIFP